MDKKKLFLHIGSHKTGSTALQVFLTENRNLLLKDGILYPDIGCPEFSRHGQHLLAWLFFTTPGYLPVFEGNVIEKSTLEEMNLVSEIKSAALSEGINSIILSSEEFSVLRPSEIDTLSKNLVDFDVEVIIYLRRQDRYLESSYSTSVLYSGYIKNFSDYLNAQRMNLNYYELVKNWENSFGGRVYVRSYEDPEIKKDIVSDFCKLININNGLYTLSDNRINESISVHAVEVIRGLKLRGWTNENLTFLRKKLAKLYSSYDKEELGSFINKNQYMELKKLHKNENKKLKEEYLCSLIYEDEYEVTNTVKDFDLSLIKVFSDLLNNEGCP